MYYCLNRGHNCLSSFMIEKNNSITKTRAPITINPIMIL